MNKKYTLSEIKSYLNDLKYKAVHQENQNILNEIRLNIKQSNETSMDISSYNAAIKTASSLYEKYNRSRKYSYNFSCSAFDLTRTIELAYQENQNERIKKIENQFETILKRITELRSAAKAIEFLKIFEIELPDNESPETVLNVDVEFIKSILPKNKLLTSSESTKQE